MSRPDSDPEDAADHVEETVQRMAELHADYEEGASRLQRRVARLTRVMASPWVLLVALTAVLTWTLGNAAAPRFRLRAFDAPPYNLLELIATVVALFTTLMILTTQRREEEAARRRSQLTLQLASLSEQKIAKVIALLEEQRRENPALLNRRDDQAEDMSQASDPAHVLHRIVDTHSEG